MQWSEIGWMVFVVILAFIILYQQREIRKLRAILSGRRNSSPDENDKPENAADKSSD